MPLNDPIRAVKKIADAALKRLEPRFKVLYSKRARPWVPPEVLIEANVSMKSFRSKKGGGGPACGGSRDAEIDYQGRQRRKDTHASPTEPGEKRYKKGNGQPAQLCYQRYVLMENRTRFRVETRG